MHQVPHQPNYGVPQPTAPSIPAPNTNSLINAASSQIPPSHDKPPAIPQVSPQAAPYENSPAPQNGKDANNRMKPSEILTVALMVGDVKIQNHKIFTKIHYGKKQFVWELSEHNSSVASPGHTSPSHDGSEQEKCKKKLELRFSDIEKLDVITKPGHEHEIHISKLAFRCSY
jgi:hypothetical protein